MGKRRRAASPAGTASAAERERARVPRARLALVVAGLAALAAAGLWLARRPRARPDVLLVTIDTLRADRLGCYGAKDAQTPALDGLAARGARFVTAIAHAPLTTPSHASLLTGLTPLRHGVRDNGAFVLPSGLPVLAEVFRAAGYRTAAFVSGFPLDRRFGLARGFDSYDDRLPHGNDPRRAPYVERRGDLTTDVALRWLAAEAAPAGEARAPLFVWVHYFDPHAPYEPPGEFASRFRERPYDGEVAFADAQLGRLLQAFEASAGQPPLVLATSDHGESLGEHGEDTHGVFVYDSTLRVPLIVAGPGVPQGGASSVVARGIDVAPTLLELSGLPLPRAMEGRSLREALLGRVLPDAPAYAESLFAERHLGWAALHAWRSAGFKLIDAPRPELYDLGADPGETRDLSGERRDVLQRLRPALHAARSVATPAAEVQADAGARERLAALGYLGGGAPASAANGRDPKDGIALLREVERGLAEARANPQLAIAALGAVLKAEPRMTLALRYRAIALQQAGRPQAALADLDALRALGPPSVEDLVLRAETARLAGRGQDGLAALEEAARLDPRAPEPALMRGRLLRALGRRQAAADAFRRTLELQPEHAEALRSLGDLQAEAGDNEQAARYYARVLAADPRDAEALVRLGIAYVRGGRLAEALPLLESAVAQAPGSAEAQLSLAGALAKSGRPAEAVPHFERALALGGATSVALNGLGFARLEAGDTRGAREALRASLALAPGQPAVKDALERLARVAEP